MLRNLFGLIFNILLFAILTILTQIGGIVLLITFALTRFFEVKRKALVFLSLYLVFTLFVVPPLAKLNGRVPLTPITQRTIIKPVNVGCWLFNRHYVTPELKQAVWEVANNIGKHNPGLTLIYFDANFPFFNGFPLLPHLSHNDGKKLDLGFYYTNSNGKYLATTPSIIGYGCCEKPKPNEENKPKFCRDNGYFQYSYSDWLMPDCFCRNMEFSNEANRLLLEELVASSSIQKIFIEPHLKNRLNVNSSKIRFHGCHAVRHDDHIHIQL